jgi:NAD(P) transhydrogenase subunit alpha
MRLGPLHQDATFPKIAGNDNNSHARSGGAFHADGDFEKAGGRIVPDAASLLGQADVVVKVQKPTPDEVDRMREGVVLVSFLQALGSPDLVQRLAARRITSFGMEGVPRISRAQKMDALSSQANIAGYKAVLIAAESLAKFFPMLMTAAGTVFAARVLVIGAGVAGLQAIATARRLGAQVWGYDVRAAVKEQVESLGAKFLAFDLGIADAEDKGGYAKALSADARPAGSRRCSRRGRRTSTSSSRPRSCRAGPPPASSTRTRSRACGPAR